MKGALDSQSIDIPCPHCGNKLSETIGKLNSKQKLRCRHCGSEFDADASREVAAAIRQVEKALADLQRTLGRLGK